MDMSAVRKYYPLAAERFSAVEYNLSTPLSEILELSPDIAITRMRDDGALVIQYQGNQEVVQRGEVIRLNGQTGALRIMSRAEFESTHGLAQS